MVSKYEVLKTTAVMDKSATETQVQFVFTSSISLTPQLRKSKSDEDLASLKDDPVFQWLRKVCDFKKPDAAVEKLQDLSDKLKQPGGAEKLKYKIKKYFKTMPSQFDTNDKERHKIRKQLPKYIVKKLKSFFDKQSKNGIDIRSLVRILAEDQNFKKPHSLKSILKTWVKSLVEQQNINEIAEKSLYNSLLNRIRYLFLHQPNTQDELRDLLMSNITDIVHNIALNKTDSNNSEFNVEVIVQKLVDRIAEFSKDFESKDKIISSCIDKICQRTELQNSISGKLTLLFSNLDIVMHKKLKDCINNEVSKLFLNIMEYPGVHRDDKIIIDICYLLQAAGIPELQAMYISESILKEFKSLFIPNFKIYEKGLEATTSSDSCIIQPMEEPVQRSYDRTEDRSSKTYFSALNSCVHKWLSTLLTFLPIVQDESFRDKAAKELVKMLIDSFENLTLDQLAKDTPSFIADHLTGTICQWIQRLASKDNIEIMDRVPELIKNIQQVPFTLTKSDSFQFALNRLIDGSNIPDNPKIMVLPVVQPHSQVFSDVRSRLDIDHYVQKEILEWLWGLSFTEGNFQRNAINNLASDIKARRKYLELNPSLRGTDEEELENLKYYVFKWLKRVASKENDKLIVQVPQLMQRLKNISKMVEETAKTFSSCNIKNNANASIEKQDKATFFKPFEIKFKTVASQTKASEKCDIKADMSRQPSCSYEINNDMYCDPETNCFSVSVRNKWISDDEALDCKVFTVPEVQFRTNTELQPQNLDEELPGKMNLTQTYQYFDKVFKKRCDEISLVDVTKTGMYNAIWKCYFRLKSDPAIEYDYKLFEELLLDQITLLLEFLPKSDQLENFKRTWTQDVVDDVIGLLTCVHQITNSFSYRETLTEKINRQFINQYNRYLRNKIQYMFTAQTADAYVLYVRYKNSEPNRAQVYKKRFIARIEELADRIKGSHEVNMQHIDKTQLCREVFKVIRTVPVPSPNKLEEEADEILMRDEIEIWYNELPVVPAINEMDNLMRHRDREGLAKTLYSIEKLLDSDSAYLEMMREVIWYLEVESRLDPDKVSYIKEIAEDLVRRLMMRKQRVLDRSAVEQSLNMSLNNTTLYNSMHHESKNGPK